MTQSDLEQIDGDSEYHAPGKSFEVRFETKVKNSVLKNAREHLGLSIKEAAEKIGISPCRLYTFENMRDYPCPRTQKKICNYYRRRGVFIFEEDVFPQELRKAKIKGKYITERSVPLENLLPIHSINERFLPQVASGIEKYMDSEELKKQLAECTSQLTDREQKVLKMRYEDGMSCEEIGKVFGVGRNRISQIENHAMQRLRHPCRLNKLIEFLEVNNPSR